MKSDMNSLLFHACTILLPLLILLSVLHKHFFTNQSPKKRLPPSPNKLPIIGNLHQIGPLAHRSLHRLSQHHGELMLLHFGQKPVFVVSSAKVACEIMKTQDIIFADRPQLNIFKRLLYNCKDIATSPYNDYWKYIKNISVLHLLNSKRVHSFSEIRREEVDQMIREVEVSSGVISLSRMFVTFTSDVICRVAFGVKFKGEVDGINFNALMEKHEGFIGEIDVGEFIPWLWWIDYVNGKEKEIKRVARDMNRCLEGIIQRHIGQSSVEGSDGDKSKNLVDVLLELQQEDTNNAILDQESIKAIILDMFVAGTTTSFATLEWAMSELLRNPTTMELIKKDVRGIAGNKASITEDLVDKMTYLKAVIKETLRLHPPVPLLLPRISLQDAKINGYDIPARSQVIINAWAIHRDPSAWTVPEEFKPERFLNSSVDYKGQYFNLIPFGSGRRMCPGIFFAISNIELALANLVNKFDWRLPDGINGESLDMTEHPALSIHRAVPLMAIATTPLAIISE